MLAVFQKENYGLVKRLLELMLPIIGTQLAIIGMNFFDASMSGQAGQVDLAGAAIGGNIWMPVQTGISGILMAAMPLVANYLGAGEANKLTNVVKHGLLLALGFGTLVLIGGLLFLPSFLQSMGLEPAVYHVALWYLASLGLGIYPFFMITPLRSFVDTLGYTRLTMKIYLLALPINGILNYILIYGKLGLPALGGIGAGLATALSFWLLFIIFVFVITRWEPFKSYKLFSSFNVELASIKEYLWLGAPMGFSIFMETSVFGVVALFIAKFGTDVIAAHQAALNFSSLIYMVPLSFSLALTIAVGVEYGAKNYEQVKLFTKLGLQLSGLMAVIYMAGEGIFRQQIALIYTQDSNVQALVEHFMIYAIIWQAGDTVAAPIQGVLRGCKDVNATFWASMLAYWVICLPVGLWLDYSWSCGPFAYWQSLDAGVAASAILLSLRAYYLQRRFKKQS